MGELLEALLALATAIEILLLGVEWNVPRVSVLGQLCQLHILLHVAEVVHKGW